MALNAAFATVGRKLQEVATGLSHNDLSRWLSDALSAIEGGRSGWLVDFIGDGESGDVIYSCDGDLMRAPYEISLVNGKQTASIDTDKAEDVLPRTEYVPEADEDDHYASLESAKLYQPGAARLCERFVSKAERASADSGSFAGKGKSFPILKAADVMAAVHAMGRAGSENYSAATIKANIIRIAKAKGFTSSLPKAWQGDDAKEAAKPAASGLRLVESAATTEVIRLQESRADYEIKLIAPGKGSSAFYPAEVLKRDGPNVFKAGTQVYLNHATPAEEAARPEGDVRNLAGVLTTAARYEESHPKGPGLFARMKVFADHAQVVEEKAPHVGMSIRATGIAESGAKRDGLPVLKELTGAESVDVVTRAGAGGMILTEAARAANSATQEASMDAEEKRVLQEALAANQAITGQLLEKETRREAIAEAAKILRDVSLTENHKSYVVETVMRQPLPKKDGVLDMTKFTEAVTAEAQRYAASIGSSVRVTGMGASPAGGEPLTDKQRRKEARRAAKTDEEDAVSVFESLGMDTNAAKLAATWREV